MGSWGYEPSAGDSPHDMLFPLADDAAATLVRAFKGGHAPWRWCSSRKRPGEKHLPDPWFLWARLGVVQLMSEKWQIPIPLEVAKQCLADIEDAAKDAEFVANWRDPREFMAMARSMWGWLAAELKRIAEYKPAVRKTGRKLKRGSRMPKPKPVVYEPIFGQATRIGREGRRRIGAKKLPLPKELAAALRKTLKAAMVLHDAKWTRVKLARRALTPKELAKLRAGLRKSPRLKKRK